jgi:hypothetical protein
MSYAIGVDLGGLRVKIILAALGDLSGPLGAAYYAMTCRQKQ